MHPKLSVQRHDAVWTTVQAFTLEIPVQTSKEALLQFGGFGLIRRQRTCDVVIHDVRELTLVAHEDDAAGCQRHWNLQIERVDTCGLIDDHRVEFSAIANGLRSGRETPGCLACGGDDSCIAGKRVLDTYRIGFEVAHES